MVGASIGSQDRFVQSNGADVPPRNLVTVDIFDLLVIVLSPSDLARVRTVRADRPEPPGRNASAGGGMARTTVERDGACHAPRRRRSLVTAVVRPPGAGGRRCADPAGAGPASGLSSAAAAARLRADGPNRVAPPPRRHLAVRILRQLTDPLVALLLAAAVVTTVLGDLSDTAVIVLVVVVNTAIGVVQEVRADRAVAALDRLAAPTARVVRDGRDLVLPAADLVRGDLVRVEAGDVVPADLLLIEAAAGSSSTSRR